MNNNKYALITGGSSGIGFELAKLFAKDGYNLILVARGREDLVKAAHELTQKYNVRVLPMSKDLFEPSAPFEVYDELRQEGIMIDVLVNDAGQGQYGEFVSTDLNRELKIIQLNIISLVVLTKLFVKEMVARREGKILNLASIAGKVPGPLQSVYHGTKAFVHSFTESIRNELKDTGVTVTSLLPGATDTDFFNKAQMNESKIVQEGDLADPADVAADGYKALMNNDDMVISGMKNKAQVLLSNITPDEMVAEKMHKQQAPVEPKKRK